MKQRAIERICFLAGNASKNLFRYRKRYMMFGVILFLLTAVFTAAEGVHMSAGTSARTAEFALRLAWVSGILLVIMNDVSAMLTIAVRRDEIAVEYILGTDAEICLIALWFELLVFYSTIWLKGDIVGSIIAENAVWSHIFAGPAVSGLITAIRLTGIYVRLRRKSPVDFMMEGRK